MNRWNKHPSREWAILNFYKNKSWPRSWIDCMIKTTCAYLLISISFYQKVSFIVGQTLIRVKLELSIHQQSIYFELILNRWAPLWSSTSLSQDFSMSKPKERIMNSWNSNSTDLSWALSFKDISGANSLCRGILGTNGIVVSWKLWFYIWMVIMHKGNHMKCPFRHAVF